MRRTGSLVALTLALAACAAEPPTPRDARAVAHAPASDERPAPPAPGAPDAPLPGLSLSRLAEGVFVHTSWRDVPGFGRFPSNGLVLIGEEEAWVIDSAWGEAISAELFDRVERELGRPVGRLVVTHSHDDRVAGVAEARRRGIPVVALELAAARARAAGYPPPTETFTGERVLEAPGLRVELFHPGAAHAPDNVVAWLPGARVLFGGCMIREAKASSLGNLADASLDAWRGSLDRTRARYPDPAVVVPGHGAPGDATLLDHTRSLVEHALEARR